MLCRPFLVLIILMPLYNIWVKKYSIEGKARYLTNIKNKHEIVGKNILI